MCGIAGYIGNSQLEENKVENCLKSLSRRGPDSSGVKNSTSSDKFISLLHTRLSIIDTNEQSNQPFIVGDWTIVFNGELYNYLEIRKELEHAGVVFRTKSDTEVFLQAFIFYGESAFSRFEGMWAAAIYKCGQDRVLLTRDRFGEKPLYYLQDSTGIFFASEVKALSAISGKNFEINYAQIKRYIVNGYRSLYKSDELFFQDILEVPIASFGYISFAQKVLWKKYWTPKLDTIDIDFQSAIEILKDKLFNAVSLRLRSDVPLAFCLSGGIDSGGLASIASKVCGYNVSSFSIIDTDSRYNELENINSVVTDLECASFKHTLSYHENFFDRLKMLISYHDAPIATLSYYIHAYLSEEISRQGYKVAISGSGADELFSGYYDHFNLHLATQHGGRSHPSLLADWRKHILPIVRNPYLQDPDLFLKRPDFRGHIYLDREKFIPLLKDDFTEDFYEQNFCDDLLRNRMLNELFHEGIPVILHEDDCNSMFYSIENRSPYLDRDLFEFAYSLPTEYLIKDGYAKYPLREALAGILVDSVRLDRTKKGFNASLESILDLGSPITRDILLEDSPLFDIIDREKFEQLLSMKNLSNSYSKFFFNIINVKIFLELFS